MKIYAASLAILLCFGTLTLNAQTTNPAYDKNLAITLGADDYGMKEYVLVILKTGTAKIPEKATVDSLFKGHMQNIDRLATEGKLLVAGPIGKNESAYRGIFILNVKTVEEARALVNTDPAISANLLAVDLYKWYGPAALPVYLKEQEKVNRLNF